VKHVKKIVQITKVLEKSEIYTKTEGWTMKQAVIIKKLKLIFTTENFIEKPTMLSIIELSTKIAHCISGIFHIFYTE